MIALEYIRNELRKPLSQGVRMGCLRRTDKASVLVFSAILAVPGAGLCMLTNRPQSSANGVSQQPASTDSSKLLVDGPGRDKVKKACATCHTEEIITQQHFTESEWRDVVGGMVTRGAAVSDDDEKIITGYLSRFYGKPLDPK